VCAGLWVAGVEPELLAVLADELGVGVGDMVGRVLAGERGVAGAEGVEPGVELDAPGVGFLDGEGEGVVAGRGGLALRLGFRQIKGLSDEDATWLTAARGNGYQDVEAVWRRAGIGPAMIERLSEADAYACLGITRREALWAAKAIKTPAPLPLFSGDMDGEGIVEPTAHLPQMSLGEEVVEDYVALRLSLKAHPVALLRHILTPPPQKDDPKQGRANRE